MSRDFGLELLTILFNDVFASVTVLMVESSTSQPALFHYEWHRFNKTHRVSALFNLINLEW